jgi:hypothetical protein
MGSFKCDHESSSDKNQLCDYKFHKDHVASYSKYYRLSNQQTHYYSGHLYYAMSIGKYLPTFRNTVAPSSLGSSNSLCLLLDHLTLNMKVPASSKKSVFASQPSKISQDSIFSNIMFYPQTSRTHNHLLQTNSKYYFGVNV